MTFDYGRLWLSIKYPF